MVRVKSLLLLRQMSQVASQNAGAKNVRRTFSYELKNCTLFRSCIVLSASLGEVVVYIYTSSLAQK